ncbi:uncharacterized protein LOC116340729 [Contarinia nasturtii]|uniref:uncharacterized protein LOC116340729 n=1 Tax=Contarinia nasturtii TaxID=265458 RepID=UPI0012D4B42D|nr:uncharacterized protein LOC116340729 [Contarinia nasturtii]
MDTNLSRMDVDQESNPNEIDIDPEPHQVQEFNTKMYKPTKSTHTAMCQHVVWPRFLAQRKQSDLSEHETALIELMIDVVDDFVEHDFLPRKISKLLKCLHNVKTSMTPEVISRELSQLQSGEMKSIYIESQNCCLLVYMLPPPVESPADGAKQLIVSTFPVSLSAEKIADFPSSDIKMDFPAQSIKVEHSQLFQSIEFAQQLVCVSENNDTKLNSKEVIVQNYVSQWLIPILGNRHSSVATDAEFGVITKKIRDDVLGSKSAINLPFRRSSYWAATKVSLQLSLTIEYGKECGKFLYKLIMLKYLTVMCSFYTTEMYPFYTDDIDNVSQLLAKMARRIEKLQHLYETSDNRQFADCYDRIVKDTKMMIKNARKQINDEIERLQSKVKKNSTLTPLEDLHLEADAKQTVPTLRAYLAARQTRDTINQKRDFLTQENWIRYDFNSTTPPNTNLFDQLEGQIATGLFLCDFENWLLYKLDGDVAERQITPENLRSFSTKYEEKAVAYYKDDPIGYSRMLLTQLTMVMILDKMAVKAHSLYNKYEIGVNEDIFDRLLLPHQRDMDIACKLQEYFRTRNHNKLVGILEEKPTSHSFGCKFAKTNIEMRKILLEIKQKDDKEIQELRSEYEEAKQKMQKLQRRANELDCKCLNENRKRKHTQNCPKCLLTSKISGIRVRRYERILPDEKYQQLSLVFELAMPSVFVCLRDVLYTVVDQIQKKPMRNITIVANWFESEPFNQYATAKCERVFLGTTSCHNLSRRGYSKEDSPDKLFESFHISNGYSLTYYAAKKKSERETIKKRLPSDIKNQTIDEMCRFNVEESSLQWMLIGNHTQNEVIARQSECPQHLTLGEYNNFGSLRADGHRLQMRKLYALIATESLSFETQSVQALIMQTLWQLGPNRKRHWSKWYRDAHEDFTNPRFVLEMCKLIDNYIECQKSNWKHPRKLMTTAVIAVRMFEMNYDNGDENEQVADRIAKFLQKLRDISISWISKVQEAIVGQNQQQVVKLRTNLVEIAIAGALTFFVHNRHPNFEKIFINSETTTKTASQLWLTFLKTLNSNVLLDESNKMDSNLCIFLRLIRTIGINLEKKVGDLIRNDLELELYPFIKEHWIRSQEASQFQLLSSNNQCFAVQIIICDKVNHVQVDMVTGDFLVNNFPVARLPSKITENQLFKRVFNQFIFEVQQENSEEFSSKIHANQNCHYNFQIVRKELIITELHEDGNRFELIPIQILKNEISHLLIKNHSHWWDIEKKCIYFRPPQFSDANFSTVDGVQYCLDLKDGSLKHIKTQQRMLDISSQSYCAIAKRLFRLESKKFIHISINETNIAMVKLMRMNLKFVVKPCKGSDNRYEILSNEFSNMCVSQTQNCGTLYGLHSGLLLESTDSPNQSKMLIMPHGSVLAEISKRHEIVRIDTKSELRSPPFHTYLVDEQYQQLKAKNTSFAAWFYLAYLHALTSHGQVEPLLGMSGTQRALQILQSAFVWSSAPYDVESLKTLKDIEALSPIRVKNVNQVVRWPNIIHPHAAQDSYALITRKLIDDSNRLKDLHETPKKDAVDKEKEKPKPSKENEIPKDELKENQRDYFRILPLYTNFRISKTFIDYNTYEQTLAPRFLYEERVPNALLRKIAVHYHEKTFKAPNSLNLSEFLMNNRKNLQGIRCDLELCDIRSEFGKGDLANWWISLYEIAREGQCSRETYALILSFLSLKNGSSSDAPIFALQTVANYPVAFQHIEAPKNVRMYDLKSSDFDRAEIARIIERHHNDPEMLESENHEYINEFMEYAYKIAKLVEKQWLQTHCNRVNTSIYNHVHADVDDMDEVVKAINVKLRNWNNMERLHKFIENVQNEVTRLATTTPEIALIEWQPQQIDHELEQMNRYQIDYEQIMCENVEKFKDDVNLAEEIFCREETDPMPPLNRTTAEWWNVFRNIVTSTRAEHLINASLYPHFVPSLVLSTLVSVNKLSQNSDLRSVIGALAVTMAHEQREKRIQMYEKQPQMKAALDRELENEPQTNWSAIKYPEWLLFEIEQNLTIRPIQIKIAQQMINAKKPAADIMHSVMQLNMGEGKTSVIVPIVASRLSKNKHACQVTVLKSLFATNLKSLRQCLGGLLNHRVYLFPCQRSLPVNDHVKQMLKIYKECLTEKGVILTLPEYRLSFQLKTYESTCKGDLENAQHFLEAHKWLNANIRNILDESDAILQPKYQLIYTVGNQLSLDGGNLRWIIVEALLKRVRIHIPYLYKKYGDKKIEFDPNYVVGRYEVFSPVRIFNEQVYEHLKSKIIDDFINEKLNIPFTGINERDKKLLNILMYGENMSVDEFNENIKDFSECDQNTIMVLSGLLRFDVLKLVLNKRWRVNYGVNPKSTRKMAVPFKAKDVAAEQTEFGHADVAICLTHLSYYYSGLTNEQMFEVFQILDNQQDAKDIYNSWIESVDKRLRHASIGCYSAINLSDPHQRDKQLFPLFRFNMYVIDFWLCNMVFPREAKTFEKKLMCSAWDLVNECLKHPVSGFSGTNDTQRILPLPIIQNDLPELITTNDNVRDVLLQQKYKALPANISGKRILRELKTQNIPVLLDAGALMLELNNQEVATEWLKMVAEDEYDVAVYFDTNDVMQTIDRNGIITEFDNSVFRDRELNRCIVYLDDVHTRGTDLKFPIVWRACVTLSGDITRDKTVQACMRMRLLGRGHTISFWASHEADVRLKEICATGRCHPTISNVIQFLWHNSQKFEEDNITNWTLSAYNYAKKTAAHKHYESVVAEDDDDPRLIRLYEQCVDNEYVTLNEMYGGKEMVLLSEIVAAKFAKLKQNLEKNYQDSQFVAQIGSKVQQKLSQQAAHLKRFTHCFDEEQEIEKEIEHELDQHRQIQRPPPAKASKPRIVHENLKKLIKNGSKSCFDDLIEKKLIMHLPKVLSDKHFYAAYEPVDNQAWLENVYATNDYKKIIRKPKEGGDEFLRPVLWIAKIKRSAQKDIILLLSSFEVEHLLSAFKGSNKACLFMYQPKMSQFQRTLINEDHLIVTDMAEKQTISIEEMAQIAFFSGAIYFNSEEEQNAYCNFMGLIPKPLNISQQIAFDMDQITPSGFVEPKHRKVPAICDAVENCRFTKNPIQLAIGIIQARHQFMSKESHVASILERALKTEINEKNSN